MNSRRLASIRSNSLTSRDLWNQHPSACSETDSGGELVGNSSLVRANSAMSGQSSPPRRSGYLTVPIYIETNLSRNKFPGARRAVGYEGERLRRSGIVASASILLVEPVLPVYPDAHIQPLGPGIDGAHLEPESPGDVLNGQRWRWSPATFRAPSLLDQVYELRGQLRRMLDALGAQPQEVRAAIVAALR